MYTRIIILTALALAVSGCTKEFLDRRPLGELTIDTFFENSDQAVYSVNAIYNQFRQFDNIALPYIGTTDVISDDADKGSTPTDAAYMLDLDNFTFDAANSGVNAVYAGYYKAIARANLSINRIPDVPDMDPGFQARLIGEAKFLRAYSYFLLVQWFGDLPVVTEPISPDQFYSKVRSPREEVYNLIERDLLDAIAILPEKNEYAVNDLGRATKGAAKGILAKLYMVKKDFVNAEKYLLEIINSNQYSLLPKYSDNFLPQGELGAESVFEITAAALTPDEGGVVGPGASPYNMVQGVRGVPNLGWGFNRPSNDLVKEYELNDPRREATILYVGEVLPDGSAKIQDNPEIVDERYNQKAWVPAHSGLQDNGPGNIRILRYADILLLAAEALNENGKADQAKLYLNQVRKRARGNLPPSFIADVTVSGQSELRDRIRHERRVELAMEQHRWFDLLRWGIAAERMQAIQKTNFDPNKHVLLPIPQTEVDLTDGAVRQNPGY